MRLGGRQDLTATQRETVQTIWANWSVRRAGAAIDNNDNQRAVEILEAASLAFPDNLTVRKVLAGGIPAHRADQGSPGALQDHPDAGRKRGRFPGSHRRGPGRERQDTRPRHGCGRRWSGFRTTRRSWPWRRDSNRPAATISAPPTTGAHRWRPCRLPRQPIGWPTTSPIPT